MWLLESGAYQTLQHAKEAGLKLSAEQQATFGAMFAGDNETATGARILSMAGNSAEVRIEGVLTKHPDWRAVFYGGGNTTYTEIVRAIATADQDNKVKDITLAIDSPGGHFDGLFDTIAAIQATKKPVTAIISGVGASAAFAIASQADNVVASNVATRVGSVGVVATFRVREDEVDIASTAAPKKRPDVTTKEGVAVVREELDALHEIFVGAIADGRGTTTSLVNANFGQGATVLAHEAVRLGMIDSVGSTPKKSINKTSTEAHKMDLAKLKAQHPETYAAAVELGCSEERDRVGAHIVMGESSGDMKTACGAIKDGSAMTATLQAAYMSAGMNRGDVSRRQDESDAADAGNNATTRHADESSEVTDLVLSKMGIE